MMAELFPITATPLKCSAQPVLAVLLLVLGLNLLAGAHDHLVRRLRR